MRTIMTIFQRWQPRELELHSSSIIQYLTSIPQQPKLLLPSSLYDLFILSLILQGLLNNTLITIDNHAQTFISNPSGQLPLVYSDYTEKCQSIFTKEECFYENIESFYENINIRSNVGWPSCHQESGSQWTPTHLDTCKQHLKETWTTQSGAGMWDLNM